MQRGLREGKANVKTTSYCSILTPDSYRAEIFGCYFGKVVVHSINNDNLHKYWWGEKNTFPITLWGLEDVLAYVRIKMKIPNIMNSGELNNQQQRDWGIHRPLRLNWMATSSISWGNVMTIEQRMTYTRGNSGSLLYLRFFLEKCDYSVDVRVQNEWCSFAWKYFVEKWILQYLPFTPSAKLWLNLELF